MPLTDEQKQALETLKGADVKDVAEAMKTTANEHYQGIFRIGFGAGKGEQDKKIEQLETDLEAEKAKITAKDAELTKLREKTPDAEEIRKDYEAKLTAKEEEKKKAIEEAEAKVSEVHGSRFDAELSAALVSAGIEPDYAKEVLVPKYRGRRKVEKDGTVKFYDDDGSTPLAANNGELPKVAAEKIKAGVDPKWIVSNADKGAGSAGTDSQGKGANKYAALQKAAKRTTKEIDDSPVATRRRERYAAN